MLGRESSGSILPTTMKYFPSSDQSMHRPNT